MFACWLCATPCNTMLLNGLVQHGVAWTGVCVQLCMHVCMHLYACVACVASPITLMPACLLLLLLLPAYHRLGCCCCLAAAAAWLLLLLPLPAGRPARGPAGLHGGAVHTRYVSCGVGRGCRLQSRHTWRVGRYMYAFFFRLLPAGLQLVPKPAALSGCLPMRTWPGTI